MCNIFELELEEICPDGRAAKGYGDVMSQASRSDMDGVPQGGGAANVATLSPEDESRAAIYALLAKLLSNLPTDDQLTEIGKLEGSDTAFGQAITALAGAARNTTAAAAEDAYHEIFIGLTRGKLLPYGSYYLTGFLHEKPLARLRNTMAALGIEGNPDVKDPEDHIASVLDMMGGLIRGDFPASGSLENQRVFFKEHVQSWAPYFFRDLEKIEEHELYAAIGTLGRVFLELEAAALEMD